MAESVDNQTTVSTAQESAPRGTREHASRVSVIFYHREGTTVLELREPGVRVVGRSFPADVAIADPSLSRLHARFAWFEGELKVKDLESTNGTHVGGVKVVESVVHSGDELLLGNVTAFVHMMTPADALQHGIESYDRIRERLHEELLRARAFGRSLTLLMIRAASESPAQVGLWAPELRRGCRPVDHLGIHDGRTVIALLPEVGIEHAVLRARQLVDAVPAPHALAVGLAVFPHAGASEEEVLAHCRQACLRALPGGEVEVSAQSSAPSSLGQDDPIVLAPSMQSLVRTARQVAPKGIPVLIAGETGTGKEMIATLLHESSKRSGPLRVINCATIPSQLTESILFGHEKGAFTGALKRSSGLFEDARDGTVFLDEIGELSLQAQASLLRVLQEKRIMRVGSTQEIDVDVRVVAATHRDLNEMVRQGTFRKDLFYRLNTVTLEVPPLRERVSEIRALAQRFLETAVAQWGGSARALSPEVWSLLERYDWPGNVRELRNVVERAVALCESDRIEPLDLPTALRHGYQSEREKEFVSSELPALEEGGMPPLDDGLFRERVRDYEIALIRDALEKAQGNAPRAAELLRIPIRTLTYKMKAYGMRIR